jgi:hypothetical protein
LLHLLRFSTNLQTVTNYLPRTVDRPICLTTTGVYLAPYVKKKLSGMEFIMMI